MSDENHDPFAEAKRWNAQNEELRQRQTAYLADDAEQQAANAAQQQCSGAISSGPLNYVPDYSRLQMRMNCLSLALSVPDGAHPPPLAEVIKRAEAYWAFVRGDP